jgi:integrase
MLVSNEAAPSAASARRRGVAAPEPDDGRRRSHITRPEYRRGRRPDNAGQTFPPEPLTRADVDRLLAGLSTTSAAGIRNRALIVVIWRAGLRIAEAIALHPRDVDLDAGTIRVRHGKGDRDRLVGLDPEACEVVALWMERRASVGLRNGHPIFAVYSSGHGGRHGKPLYTSYVRDMLKRLARKAGVDRRVHPHGFRHTMAFELANEATPIDHIRVQLGHTRLEHTERYVKHLNPVVVVDTMRARRWANTGKRPGERVREAGSGLTVADLMAALQLQVPAAAVAAQLDTGGAAPPALPPASPPSSAAAPDPDPGALLQLLRLQQLQAAALNPILPPPAPVGPPPGDPLQQLQQLQQALALVPQLAPLPPSGPPAPGAPAAGAAGASVSTSDPA